jgi:hypothetical protein
MREREKEREKKFYLHRVQRVMNTNQPALFAPVGSLSLSFFLAHHMVSRWKAIFSQIEYLQFPSRIMAYLLIIMLRVIPLPLAFFMYAGDGLNLMWNSLNTS